MKVLEAPKEDLEEQGADELAATLAEFNPAIPMRSLSGLRKSAVLLVALGTDVASKVLRCLSDKEVERISIEIAKLRSISSAVVEEVFVEFRDKGMVYDAIAVGGASFVRTALLDAFGDRRTEEVMMKVEAAIEVSAFHLLHTIDSEHVAAFLQGEHPQTAALILAHLNPRKAGEILAGITRDRQAEIVSRLAKIGETSPDVLRDVQEVIRQQIGSLVGAAATAAGGVEAVAEILNNTSRSVSKVLMESLKDTDADLASAIKSLMFVFDDLVRIGDRDMQRLLMEVDQKDLAVALKAVSDDLSEKILRNVSERAAQTIKEDLELMGPVRLSEVDEAQRRILEAAQGLEERGEISLATSSTGGDMML